MLNEAVARHNAGDLREAERLYRAVLIREPDHPEALRLLGEVLKARGELGAAIDALSRAVESRPDCARAQTSLAVACHEAGLGERALAAFRCALELDRSDPDAHNNLGTCLSSRQELVAAIECFEAALELSADHGAAAHNLTSALLETGAWPRARVAAERAAALAPRFPPAYVNLATACLRVGEDEAAHRAAGRALALAPGSVDALIVMERVHRARGELEAAVACLRKVVELSPGIAAPHNDLAMGLMALGRAPEARLELERAIEADPGFAIAYENLARARPARDAAHALVGKLERLLADERLGDAERCSVSFALGVLMDDLGHPDRAFACLSTANALKRRSVQHDADVHDAWVGRLLASFSPELLERLRPYGSPSRRPLFIVGMPRSGTTLVEQILASHPEVRGAGELTDFYDFARGLPERMHSAAPYPECVRDLSPAPIGELAAAYLAHLHIIDPVAEHVTDKMPVNFLHLGLISLAFPHAKVIHCARDPLDTGLSIYFQHFASRNAFAYDLAEIGRYHRSYTAAMAHFERAISNPLLEVRYERLVEDPEPVIRGLLAFCGLSWHPGCLSFFATSRPITTASAWQVRQPLHTRSVGRWKRYSRHLDALRAGLAGGARPPSEPG